MKQSSVEYNFVVKNEHWDSVTEKHLFGDDTVVYVESFSFVEQLVKLGIFSSKGQAKKNKFADYNGFGDHVVGKLKTRISWWIPVAESYGQVSNTEIT